MNTRTRSLILIAIILLSALPLIAGTDIVRRWVLTGMPMPQLKRILIAGVMENYLIRQEFEDEMNNQLAKYGVEGIQSYMVLPPRNEMMEGELKQRIKESSLDGVLLVRPKAVRKESEEVLTGGVYVPPPGYNTLWPYWNMAQGTFLPTSTYKENIVIRVELNLYYTKDEKLIWSGETDTVYSKDFEKLGRQYAKSLVKQLKKDGVVGKK